MTVSVRDSKDADGNADTATDDTISVTITVTDINEPPVVTGTTTTEYAENDTGAVETYIATDPESAQILWSLSGTDEDDFTISQSGDLEFASTPDYEAPTDSEPNNIYQVTVQAADGNSTTTRAVTITVTDMNEKPQFPSSETGQRSVVENTASGQNVGLPIAAIDPERDSLTYTLSGADATSFDFIITSGQIRTKDALDSDSQASYSVIVSVHDGKEADGSTSTSIDDTISVTITVTDINEPPTISGTTTTEYPENATHVVERYTYDDPENDNIAWSLSVADEDDFTINQFGDLEFASTPDYENPTVTGTNNSYSVNVLAADGTSTTTYPVTITVTDVNETPQFPSSETGLRSVDENTPAGQDIGSPVAATDPDHGATLTYILDGTDSEYFDIDELTGQLKTKADLNAEGQNTYSFYVDVHDGKDAEGNPSTSSDAFMYVTITVENVNEAPVVTGATSTEYVENGNGAVATYTADDPEENNIGWSPGEADGAAFSMSAGGVLSFVSPPDYESKKVYSLTVNAFGRTTHRLTGCDHHHHRR